MIVLRVICLISALSCCLSELLPFRESNRYDTPSPVDSEPPVAIFRTERKDRAVVQRRGEDEYNPKEYPQKKGNTGSISRRVTEKKAAEMKSNRSRGGCRECPSNQTIVASKGNTFALLPEPCSLAPKKWNHHSGPKPGSKIQEGTHIIRGSIGPKKKFCEYNYQVIVNRCEPLKASDEDTTIECSADNVWGSVCIISCGEEKELIGTNETECKEDLTWSNPMPVCKSKNDCSTPRIKTKSKISCHTDNMPISESNLLPDGSSCSFKQNGKVVSITCKNGRWLKSRKSVTAKTKEEKQIDTERLSKSDACNPNPCKNGGTCLKPESNTGPPICKCRSQTQGRQCIFGVHCELRECYYNICENEGICIYQNEESICYCSGDYRGNRCQNYISSNS